MNRREAIAATTAGIVSAMGGTLPAGRGARHLQQLRDYRSWPGYKEEVRQVPCRGKDGNMTWLTLMEL